MIRGYSVKTRLLAFVLILWPLALSGQDDREYIRKGNRLYNKSEYSGSEGMYRRAQSQEKSTPDAVFNLGDALYKQGRYSEAATEFDRATEGYEDPSRKAESYYNLGNALLKDQKYKESIESYINSLKLKPDNIEAKYNLAYAQDQLKKQEEEQKDQEEKQQDENKDKSDENQNKENGQQNQEDQQQGQEQPEPQQGTMSREDAKRLLEALSAAEKKTREKVQQEKARGAKTRVIKNW